MDSAAVVALCKKYGPRLALPPGGILEPVALMCAIAENESTMGANTRPRHEPAYDRGGRYDRAEQAVLLDRYGSKAAYSYGPWQTLPCNALAYSPDELDTDPDAAAQAFVHDMNHRVLPHAVTLGEMAQVYNAGEIKARPALGVVRYAKDLQANYVAWFQKLKPEASSASSIV